MTASRPKENPVDEALAVEERRLDSMPPEGPATLANPMPRMDPPRAKSGESVDPLVGRVISDRFRVIAPIARGGMGVVYRAEQAPLGRLVALKVLSATHDEDKDPEFRKRFFLEAATVANLTHPNTVTVFDYGQAEGRHPGDPSIYYIAMELVNGRTLKKAITQEGPFDPERATNIAKQICRSLREAHRQGVIHRDMKPGNVMLVDRDGEDFVKVLDFGLVKELKDDDDNVEADLTQAGVFMGSPKYMSPEQIQGEPLDGRADIYAIGVVLYEMLTGHVPFQRDNPMQTLMDHVRTPVPPIVALPGTQEVPPELISVVMRCLEKDREKRFADMESLLMALKMSNREGTPSHTREISLELLRGVPTSGTHALGSVPAPRASSSRDGSRDRSSATTPPSGSFESRLDGNALGPLASLRPTSSVTAAFGVAPAVVQPSPEPAWKKWALPGTIVAFTLLTVTWTIVGVDSGASESARAETAADVRPGTSAAEPNAPAAPRAPLAQPAPVPAVDPAPRGVEGTSPAPTHDVRSVLISLRSSPLGAMVTIGEREYGPTPTQVELVGDQAQEGRTLELVFHRSGFRDTHVERVVRGTSMDVEARLPMIAVRRNPGSSEVSSGATDTHLTGYRESPY